MSKEAINKKAEGLSTNVIVLFVIALVAIVVIAFIAGGKLKFFNKNVNSEESCNLRGGVCMDKDSCASNSMVKLGCSDDKVCCLALCEHNGGLCKTDCSATETSYIGFYCADEKSCCIAKEGS